MRLNEKHDPTEGILGLLCEDLRAWAKRGDSTEIAQFYKLVLPGTILARHVFRGLDRPLLADGDCDADKKKLIYSRKPAYDYVWSGGPQGAPLQLDAPIGKVFVVYVTPNVKHKDLYPEIAGWIDRWVWIDEDAGLPEATEGWVDRYEEKFWTREDK